MKLAVAILSLIVLALVVPVFFLPEVGDVTDRQQYLPWVIEQRPDGNTRAMGIALNVTTVGEARTIHGPDMEVAIISAPNETGSIEAYVSSAKAGFITGRLVLVAQATEAMVEAMRERAAKVEYMESTTRKSTPSRADLDTILRLPVRSIAFIPTINLDRSAIVERFGPPMQELRPNDHQVHLLYPGKGLDIIVDTKGKELLQYVSPGDFNKLVAPLKGLATESNRQ